MLAAGLDAHFVAGEADAEISILLEGVDVTHAIRDESCGNAASKVAAMPEVRAALLERQRGFRQPPGLVADGRDMGTFVFSDAQIKIFLTARPEERAKRRYNQLKEKGISASLADLISEIAERDERDAKRQVSPLRAAEDAYILDTTRLNILEVQQRALKIVHERL
jgi:cytidylate kinase